MHDERRSLPSVTSVLARPRIARLVGEHGHTAVVSAVREVLAAARRERVAVIDDGDIEAHVRAQRTLRPVINATGVVVHTNLGRVPLAPEAIEAIVQIARGYSTLEYELAAGTRGHRHAHVVALLRDLTSAEDALVVNNNAGAMLLALGSAAGRAAIVSRGELVEIGGGFRIPDVVRQSGARLVEVGTTNRTHLADYEAAIDGDTAVLLKVHRSNFDMIGFVREVELEALSELARARGLSSIYDAGSGCMTPIASLVGERPIADHVRAGADLVAFSGDKLLGGPQAGILVGRAAVIARLRSAPLYRALRPDKLTLAALHATLALWRDAPERIPVVKMLRAQAAELEARATRLLPRLSRVETIGRVGGGAAPRVELASSAIRIEADADVLLARLRRGDPPVIARAEDGAVLIDLRCVGEHEEELLVRAIEAALA
jgi:L-seryl-tRNA(Ser) seleniumtransferase